MCECVRARFFQRAAVSSINSTESSVFIIDMQCVFLEVRTVLPYAICVQVYLIKIQK